MKDCSLFNTVSLGTAWHEAISSLRPDAERIVSDIAAAPDGSPPLADTLLHKAWREAAAAARAEGRRPRRSDALASLYTYRDRCMQGATI